MGYDYDYCARVEIIEMQISSSDFVRGVSISSEH